ncbi:MAG: hypothetical protein J6R20_08110 [Clostridia bacterium]|nr:hypothetical protein [Clostridia bacterium]
MQINFIDWVSFKDILIDANMTLAEYCAQYSAVQTNWVYTVAGIVGILTFIITKNRKWYWYIFLALYTVMSVTSVGMHTANYGEFEPFKMTTKLLASYVDMSLTELTVWWGACCATLEFHPEKCKKRTAFIGVVTAIMLIVIAVLTYEVFVIHNRPLYIGGGGAPMDGKTGGLSLAELGCFLTAVPLFYLFGSNFKFMEKTEKGLLILLVSTLLIAVVITSLWGDNEINGFLLGNFHGHSLWHILGGIAELEVVFWVNQRETNKKFEELKKQLQKAE